jgi:ABC-type nitrate/sulfonate/bicarbonate transport system substrate-binding protein
LVTFSNDINALVSGDIQFDLTAPDKVIHSALGGFPVKMVMGTARGLNLALVVHPSIRSAAGMRGKSVAITGFSGLPYTGLLLCLKELGLTKDQVVPLNIGGKAARFEALLTNKVPAAILDPPYTTMAVKEGYKLLVDLAPLDVCRICATSSPCRKDPYARMPARWRASSPRWPMGCNSIATRPIRTKT